MIWNEERKGMRKGDYEDEKWEVTERKGIVIHHSALLVLLW